MKILAIDPATKCGFAHSGGPSGTWDLSIRRDESGGMRLVRFRGKLGEIKRDMGIDVVAFESVSYTGPNMRGASFQAELVGTLKVWCEDEKIEVVGYNLSAVKKHATGKGNANKEKMIQAARDRGWAPVDDNHADALWILDLAKMELVVKGAA